MSRRSDREGIDPSSLSCPASPRMFSARNLSSAAGWRQELAYVRGNRRERDIVLAHHRMELGNAKSERGRFMWFAIP